MADSCCQLVGDLSIGGVNGCIVSINTNCSTEGIIACGADNPLEGPTTGTVSITAFAAREPWVGCPAKAGVSIPYVRKYDCDNDVVYFIPSGQGQSFTAGDTQGLASVRYVLSTCTSLSASSASGPSSIYMESEQTNGYGLTYNGGPISIHTTSDMSPFNISTSASVQLNYDLYLQSFNFDAQPGQIPTVSYTFTFGG